MILKAQDGENISRVGGERCREVGGEHRRQKAWVGKKKEIKEARNNKVVLTFSPRVGID